MKPPAPIYRRDKFRIYWVSIDTGAILSRAEMIHQLKIHEETIKGRKVLEGPPLRKPTQAKKLFEYGKSL